MPPGHADRLFGQRTGFAGAAERLDTSFNGFDIRPLVIGRLANDVLWKNHARRNQREPSHLRAWLGKDQALPVMRVTRGAGCG